MTEEEATEIRSLGSTTWGREDLQKGIEADECYYIQNELAVRGKSQIDLSADPPPDLAIAIDITSSSMSRLEVYAALGVPEVWRYDGQALSVYILVDNQYQLQDASLALPLLNQREILCFLTASQTMGETSLIREFRRWVREKLQNLQNEDSSKQ